MVHFIHRFRSFNFFGRSNTSRIRAPDTMAMPRNRMPSLRADHSLLRCLDHNEASLRTKKLIEIVGETSTEKFSYEFNVSTELQLKRPMPASSNKYFLGTGTLVYTCYIALSYVQIDFIYLHILFC